MKGRTHRGELLFAAGAGLAVFVLYLLTLAPTVLYYSAEHFDSPHLQIVAYVLGIPSYTGYPTYAMLSHLFTYLPFGDPAYRVNLASAVFGALAVGVVYLLCRRLGAGRTGSVAGSVAFGLGAAFWSQATIAEVYTLHALLMSLFLLALFLWRDTRDDRYLLATAFLGGLALTNHLTSIFLLPSAVALVAVVDRRKLRSPKLLLKGAGLFFAGLLPYLYLPLRASMDPPLVGAGPVGDPSTFAGFVDLVSGGGHKSRILAFGLPELPGRLGIYGSHLIENLNPALLALAAVGLGVFAVRDRAALAALGLVYALNLAYALEYDIDDLWIYFIPTYLVLCLSLARGAHLLASRAGARDGANRRRPILLSATVALVALAVLAGVQSHYREADHSEDLKGRRIVEAVAQKTEPHSTIIYHGRALHYMQLVEHRREDLRLVDPFYTEEWVESAQRARSYGPVYVLYPGATNTGLYREAGYRLVPVERGMLYRLVRER